MIHQEYFDKLIHAMTAEPFTDELKAARAEYTKVAGEVFEDDKSFEMRMTSFLEWYILDRPVQSKNRTPIHIYLDEIIPHSPPFNKGGGIGDEEREFLSGLMSNKHSIFEVKGQKKEHLKIKDLFYMEKYLVSENSSHRIFRKGDIVEARLFPFRGNYLFTNALCFHPAKAGRFITGELKKMRKNGEGNIEDFILRLSYMNLKYERARQIDANDIYR